MKIMIKKSVYDEIMKSLNHYETQPRNKGRFSFRGIKGFSRLLNEQKEKLTSGENAWIESKKVGCVPKTYTRIVGGREFTGTIYEHPNRDHKNAGYETEIDFATVFASYGYTVHLVEEDSRHSEKKIDGFINDIPIDFKTTESGSKNSLKKFYHKGMEKEHCKGIVVRARKEFEFSLDDFAEENTKQSNNGFLTVWLESDESLTSYDMEKIRATHKSVAQALAATPFDTKTEIANKRFVGRKESGSTGTEKSAVGCPHSTPIISQTTEKSRRN